MAMLLGVVAGYGGGGGRRGGCGSGNRAGSADGWIAQCNSGVWGWVLPVAMMLGVAVVPAGGGCGDGGDGQWSH